MTVDQSGMAAEAPKGLETIRTRADGGVLYATFDAPPLNLIGPELVRGLVELIRVLDAPSGFRAVVFDSADPDFFMPHVDLTKVAEYTAEAAKAGGPGDASLGMLFQRLSRLPVVTIDSRYSSTPMTTTRSWPSGTAGSTVPFPTTNSMP